METDKDITLLIFDFLKLEKFFLFLFLISCIFIFVKMVTIWSGNMQQKFSGKRLVILQITTVFTFITYLVGVVAAFYYVFQPSKEFP